MLSKILASNKLIKESCSYLHREERPVTHKAMYRQLAIEIICFLFIVLLVYAGSVKLLDLETFQIQIGQSPVLSQVAGFTALFIPVTELVIAFLLLIPKFRIYGLLASFGLMVMFTAYIIYILQFSENIPCSCGGVLQRLGWTEHLIFNLAFIGLSVAGLYLVSANNKTDKITHRNERLSERSL